MFQTLLKYSSLYAFEWYPTTRPIYIYHDFCVL